jgi:hypothetical protein
MIAGWQLGLLLDRERNLLLRKKLSEAVRESTNILEIGTGLGLVAMLLATATEARVSTCEADPAIRDIASEAFALNGLSERINLLPVHSRDLKGEELFDVLFIDNFSDDLVGYGGLADVIDAKRRFLKANALIIPHAVHVKVCLVNGSTHRIRIGKEDIGFDFSHLKYSIPTRFRIVDSLAGYEFASVPEQIISLNLNETFEEPTEGETAILMRAQAEFCGVLIWAEVEWIKGHRTAYGPYGDPLRIRNPILEMLDKTYFADKGQTVLMKHEVKRQQITLQVAGIH